MSNLLGDYLRYLRETDGLTTRDLARKADVNQSFITRLETGERRVSVLKLWHIIRALKGNFRYAIATLAIDAGVPEEEVVPFVDDWIAISTEVSSYMKSRSSSQND